jgi:chromosome partitioning protein
MKVIVVASQKGGVGKTTLTGHLGVMADLMGLGPVALIDTDTQGSLAEWWNIRTAETPLFAKVEIENLVSSLEELKKAGFKLVFIDTPPSVTNLIRSVVSVADLVLIPTRPSPHDLRAVGKTVEIVESVGKKIVFVINGAAQRAKITGEAAIALSQYGKVAPVTIFQRTDFASSMIDGRTVQELDSNGRSALEIKELWNYVSKQLSK